VPKDPVTSGNAEAGVFAYVQPDAAEAAVCRGPWTRRGRDLEASPQVAAPFRCWAWLARKTGQLARPQP
jgi:hypothetical protein